MANSGGGAATNSGIDFQQRIAAFVMAHMLCEVSEISALQVDHTTAINSVHFETGDSVDDLVLIGEDFRIFIQAKRTISASDASTSEYSSVLKQFVHQFVNDNSEDDSYVLATSTHASARIVRVLRKLTKAARLNDASGASNPLNKQEEEVLQKTRSLIDLHYRAITGSAISERDSSAIFKRIIVAVLDIEEDGALETATLYLLAGSSSISPQLLWGNLIALGLTLARDRLSIDRGALHERMGKYLTKESGARLPSKEDLFANMEIAEDISMGREVLLVEYPDEGTDYLLCELKRFNDDGSKRVKFSNGQVHLGEEVSWNVIRRFATYTGMERYIDANPDLLADKSVALAPINSSEDFDASPYAQAYAELCKEQAASAVTAMICHHCGEALSEDLAPLIEVDEEGCDHEIGLVHSSCVRSLDRHLGGIRSELFRDHILLKNFDYRLWHSRIQTGQAVFRGLDEKMRFANIAWQPHHDDFSKGSWCVRIDLEDGSSRYVTERGQVARRSKSGAVRDAEECNQSFEKSRAERDPMCYSDADHGGLGEAFAKYSQLLKIGITPVACTRALVVPLTRSIAEAYSGSGNYYAPLAFLSDGETGEPIVIAGAVSLLTNPLQLDAFVKNWERAGISLPDFTVSIVESDERFDRFIHLLSSRGLQAIVDPLILPTGGLASGFPIHNFETLISEAANL